MKVITYTFIIKNSYVLNFQDAQLLISVNKKIKTIAFGYIDISDFI